MDQGHPVPWHRGHRDEPVADAELHEAWHEGYVAVNANFAEEVGAALEDDPDATPIPGVLIHRFEAELIFANADIFQDDLLARIRVYEPPPHTVVLDFEAVSQIDVTGAQTLLSVHDTLDTRGIRLIVARAKSSVRNALRRNEILDLLGEDNLVPSVHLAVAAAEADPAPDR